MRARSPSGEAAAISPATRSSLSIAPTLLGHVPLARNHVRLIPEPQAAVRLQHLTRGIEIGAAAYDFGQAMVLDLRYVDRRIPRCEQGRCADGGADLGRQRVHVVAEQRT